MKTQYRLLEGYTGYRIGSDGSVWTRKIRRSGVLTDDWTLMKTRLDHAGRPRLSLINDDGKKMFFNVCRLVLLAFVGPCPEGLECCHRNGNARDNRRRNLRYGTRTSNARDKIIHGTQPRGEKAGAAKLTDDDVREMRRLRDEGLPYKKIADRFGVAKYAAQLAIKRKTWAHVA